MVVSARVAGAEPEAALDPALDESAPDEPAADDSGDAAADDSDDGAAAEVDPAAAELLGVELSLDPQAVRARPPARATAASFRDFFTRCLQSTRWGGPGSQRSRVERTGGDPAILRD